jgi:adenosylmethionine-8-amino-7-oxononanoate transaminase
MEEIFKDKTYIKDIRNIGLIGAIELKDNLLPNVRIGREIYNLALKKGVFMRPIGNSVYFMPPYIITNEEINKMLDVCKESIEELLKI